MNEEKPLEYWIYQNYYEIKKEGDITFYNCKVCNSKFLTLDDIIFHLQYHEKRGDIRI